jgi:shikimate kinase/3-dehydroquinate synthase
MRVVLTGFMGAGKTTVGRRLSELAGIPFFDLDERIELRFGASVREIFAREGEPAFRAAEREELERALAPDPSVVATGGGTLTFAENLELARGRGLVVWLHPSFATLARRVGAMGKSDRPLFRDETQAFALYRERLPAYAGADLRVDVGDGESAEEVAERVRRLLRERGCSI